MLWPDQRKAAKIASSAIGQRRSGLTKNHVSGTAAMPKEQKTTTGPAPMRSTAWPQNRAETMRTTATPTP